jgi:crotonobetainyl-CoA:carnitine CoA-transferase CaiB-like acyl-CoA transferase
MALQPLAGIRVLDFTAFPPGLFCGVMLADLGAEIIRVESPAQKGKPSVFFGQFALSRGKRSITLDMRHPAANDVLKRLAPTVDVVLENAKPGVMEERGFGWRQAREANPRIIWCAITGFGQTGPYADHSGHDISYLAHSGLLRALSADPNFMPGLQLAVPLGAMAAVIGIQGALLNRAKTGEGALVDASLSEAATWVLCGGINPLSDKPLIMSPTPDRRTYRCSDGRYVAVACAEPRTWNALCDGIGAPDLKDKLHVVAEAPATAEKLAVLFAGRPAMDWVEQLAPTGAAVTIVNHAKELLDDPQVKARGTILESAGVPVPASPVRISTAQGAATQPNADAPHTVGQDSVDVLLSAGFSKEDLVKLTEDGVIG